jgi:hypothetical protein
MHRFNPLLSFPEWLKAILGESRNITNVPMDCPRLLKQSGNDGWGGGVTP